MQNICRNIVYLFPTKAQINFVPDFISCHILVLYLYVSSEHNSAI